MYLKMMKCTLTLAATVLLAFGAEATDYYWVGGDSGEWTDGTKWSLSAGGEAAGAYPNSIDNDTAAVDAAATITIPSEVNANTITLNQDVTFTGAGALRFYTMAGDGKVTMSGATFKTGAKGSSSASKDTTVNNRIVVAANTENVINICAQFQHFYMNGGIEGSGAVRVDENDPLYYGYVIRGDAQSFSGTIVENETGSYNRGASQTGFGSVASVSPHASYTLYARDRSGSDYPFNFSDSQYAYIGALNGSVYLRKVKNYCSTFVIGSRNEDCSFGGQLGAAANYLRNIIKVGTAELEYTGTIYGYVSISNGTFRIGSTNSVPSYIAFNGGTLKQDAFDEDLDVSAKIKNSSEQIVFDDEGVNHAWATALDASNEKGLTKKGDGTLSLVKSQTLNGPLIVEGGKIGMVGELSGEEETLFTWTTAGSSVTLDSFAISVEDPFVLALVDNAESSMTSLVVGHPVTTFVWTGAEDSRWANTNNWTVDGKVTEFYPAANDTVVIALENQNIAITPNVAFGTFKTLADSTTFTVLFTEAGQTYAIPTEKVAAEKFSVAQPFTASAVLSEGVYTAGARASATYTWGGKDGAWNEAANWRIDGKHTGVWPTTGDTASFPAAADGSVVTLVNGIVISGAEIAEGVTITYSGASGMVDIQGDITGSGKLVLSNVGFYSTPTTSHNMINIETPIEVPKGSVAKFRIDAVKISGDHYGCGFTLTGKLTGSGTIESYSSTGKSINTNQGLHLEGDGSDFAGIVTVYSNAGQQRDRHTIKPIATSSNAVWRLYADGLPLYSKQTVFATEDATYYLGAVMYEIYNVSPGANATYEIGALDLNSYFHSIDKGLGNDSAIRWIAPTATFTNDVTNVSDLQIVGGGTVVVTSTNTVPGRIMFSDKGGTLKTKVVDGAKIDPSAKFLKCKVAICFDDEGEDYAWATVIDASNAGGLTKRGAGTLSLARGTALNGALRVEGGKMGVVGGFTGEEGALLSWQKDATAREITLDDFAEKAVLPVRVAIVTNETTISLTMTRESNTYVYVGPDLGNWSDAQNWQMGGAAATVAPSSGDAVSIGGGNRVIVEPGQTVGEVAMEDGAKLAVRVTEDGQAFTQLSTVTKPLTTDDVVALGPFALTLEDGVFTAKRVPSTFVWTDATADHEWNTPGNWKVGNLPTAVLPNVNDNAEFPAKDDGWTLAVSGSDANASNVTFAANVAISHCTAYLRPRYVIGGEGVITLGDDAMIASYDTGLSVSNDLVVTASDTNPAQLYISGSSRSITLYGDITGSGTLQSTCAKNANYSGTHFRGDLRGFTGRFMAPANNIDRNQTQFEGEYSWSENARFEVSAGAGYTCAYSGNTFKFGSFVGKMSLGDQQIKNMTIEIGNLNSSDDTIEGLFFASRYPNLTADRGHTLRKVGSGTLEVSVINNKAYDVNGGVMRLMNDRTIRTMWKPDGNSSQIVTDPAEATGSNDVSIVFSGTGTLALNPEITLDISGLIANSSGAVAIDDEGENYTWATAIAASNVGGFTKKGAGTLTLSEVPLYAGLTTVEAGTLVVPNGTEVTLNAASAGTIKGGTVLKAVFTAGTKASEAVTDPSEAEVKSYACAVDCGELVIDLSEKTDWEKTATYYVVTPGGIVAGTSVVKGNCQLILPEEQQGKWSLSVVTLPASGKVLALVSQQGLIITIR